MEEFDPRDFAGFLPCRLAGLECGFEYDFRPLEADDEELRDRIGDSDRVVEFVLHGGSQLDLTAALRAAAALTHLSGGIYYDPQSDQTATHRGVYDILHELEKAERTRGRLAAEEDAAMTTHRCPHCGAPCPTYRKTCKACGRSVRGQDVDLPTSGGR